MLLLTQSTFDPIDFPTILNVCFDKFDIASIGLLQYLHSRAQSKTCCPVGKAWDWEHLHCLDAHPKQETRKIKSNGHVIVIYTEYTNTNKLYLLNLQVILSIILSWAALGLTRTSRL